MKRVFMRFDALTPQAIGEAVRLRRKALGNTLDDLAEASGISKRTLIKLEQGQAWAVIGFLGCLQESA